MNTSSGYSGTPLVRKLGVKPSFRVKTRNAPGEYKTMLDPLPAEAVVSARMRAPVDIYHLFVRSAGELRRLLPVGLKETRQQGMIWVSWPKKSSGVVSDLSENIIRDMALPLGLVDVKVCAIDQTWSGLKLVIRRENRK